jgi:hypothetical protein
MGRSAQWWDCEPFRFHAPVPILRSLSALQDDVEPTERDAIALRYNRNGTISPKISTFDGAGLRSLKSSAKLDVP